ncbi:YeeE/YedE family protein [Hyphomicrobium sp.]|uniref:YeeE/YedE family protein n=1 Tax=Hyphomicrobium sp. TaxID=82 RepID=UPI000FB26BC0|nr:YeeE/YedE family protein [Hyphomicrobium sp.]RUO98611.1 MAG: YeeE/YedE family protein [Hyphomicrobium sp.]
MILLVNVIAGLLFGFGLLLSGMANPAKVLNFLDVAGHWDASLAFVMGGAVLVTAIGYRLVFRRPKPVLDESFRVPTARQIDSQLVLGAAVFGVGWGLVGLCPGPALVSLPLASPAIVVFVPAMLIGVAAAVWLKR